MPCFPTSSVVEGVEVLIRVDIRVADGNLWSIRMVQMPLPRSSTPPVTLVLIALLQVVACVLLIRHSSTKRLCVSACVLLAIVGAEAQEDPCVPSADHHEVCGVH